ncbi:MULTISPECIES: hypothetical protein [unclassified Sinorhizobium]|uniref:hypothetical protein n=1 Tax=unclassified Sinorhizobium TaxID=2613772 RepID=UPI0024C32FD3|nr:MULTISPECIES: hypothetical protein [unclassified Sinorhizobium]MDK1375187.1 hypothetical protein [Sinorhizobium sp. 6-70]MDK1480919.1 hypothetical protein [Sinorhizobium sp. 6-117]
MGFTQSNIEGAGGDWELAATLNADMDALRSQRIQVLPLTGDLRRSKLAWKYAVLRQSLTYRLVDLVDAAVEQWGEGNSLACMVLARAFFETVAVVHFIEQSTRKALEAKDLGRLDQLAMQATFGGRSDYWRMDNDPAISVMTALDKLSRELPRAREFYEHISEVAHPNSQGTHQFYSVTDTQRIEVTFSREKRNRGKILGHLMAALIGLPWSIQKLADIDALIPQIADLQSPAP